MSRRRKQQGFTLVEILIVVVILGILAAIVIPQFTSASESARASSLITQLQSIRSQLELAQIQHTGSYPDLSTDWNQMTNATDPVAGYTIPTTPDGDEVGPYLQQPPNNPFQASTVVTTFTAGTNLTPADGTAGWAYDQTSGAFYAVMDATKAGEVGLDTRRDTDVIY